MIHSSQKSSSESESDEGSSEEKSEEEVFHKLNKEQQEVFKQAFDMFDRNKSGTLQFSNLRKPR